MKYYGRRRKKRRNRIIAAAISLFLISAVIFVLISVAGAAKISNITSLVLKPVVSLYRNVKESISDSFNAFSENKKIIEENRMLGDRVRELEAEMILMDVYMREIDEYKELLSLQKELSDFDLITAKVVFTTFGNLQTGLTINIGASKNIEKGMPVIYGDKLLGIIRDVDMVSARVRTIYENDFAIIARNAANGEILRVRGNSTAYFRQLLICDYLPLRSEIKEGDLVETSVLGETYPDSIRIGIVDSIEYDRDGMPVKAFLKPCIDPRKIDTVYVLRYKETDHEPGE